MTLIIAPIFEYQGNIPIIEIKVPEDSPEDQQDENGSHVVYQEAVHSSRSLRTSPIHTLAVSGPQPFQYQFHNEDFSILPMRVRKSLDLSSKIVKNDILPDLRKRLIKESIEYFDTSYPNPNINMGKTVLKDEFPKEYDNDALLTSRSNYTSGEESQIMARSLPANLNIRPPASPRRAPSSPRSPSTRAKDPLDPNFNSKEISKEIYRIRNIKVPYNKPPPKEGPNDDPAARFRQFNEEYAALFDEKSWRKKLGFTQPLTPPTRGTAIKSQRESRRYKKPSSPSPKPIGVFFDYRHSSMFQPRIAPE